MSKRDAFGDDLSPKAQTDFASLFEQSLASVGRQLSNGDKLTGEILSIGKEESFISTSTPKDAMILTQELLDDQRQLKYKVGDQLDCVVVSTKGGEIRVIRAGSKKSSSDLDSLEDAYDMELPVEGRVTEVCNGGFRVSVQGKTAFCPVSQMDYRVLDHQSYVDKKFDFMITKFDPKGRNLVVSRRRLLDAQKVESEGAFLDQVKPGEVLSGTISRLEKFGAFVTLDSGVEGLVHISEIGWSRIQDPSEVVRVGQSVSVKLLRADEVDGKLKISLSIKQAGGEGDPWTTVPMNFPVGSAHKGTVEKKEVYGLFVNIAPGITGLLPKSKWRDSVDHQKFEMKKKGDVIDVQVDEILFDQKKMSLGLPSEIDDQSWKSVTSAKSGFVNNGGLSGLADLVKKQ
ncbi:MAG: S1 RNA-binding domain-containing protein [Bdellovibrionaceae bacterium]|nr:S1 RNA-binding domain-containing protein [Bdellovibrio sp.]